MSIAKALSDNSLKQVESGGLYWKVKRIKSKDLMRAGIASLVHLAPEALLRGEIMDGEDTEETLQKMQTDWTEKLGSLTDVQQARLYDSLDAVVCAGVVEVSGDGENWEAIRFTMKDREHNPDKGVLLIETLPNETRQELAGVIQNHSRAIGGGAEALAAFRE
jgi:hypothetical protein